MENNTLHLTKELHQFLKKSLNYSIVGKSEHNRKKIEQELKEAVIYKDAELPVDAIRTHSEVILMDLTTTKTITINLVPASEANPKVRRISVLSPLGIAIIGYRPGAIIEWEMPVGKRKYKVVSVMNAQPEKKAKRKTA